MFKDIKYFDYAATTFLCAPALEAYVSFQKNIGVLWGKGNNLLSEESRKIFNNSVDVIRYHFGIDNSYEFIIGKNVTELINIIAYSLQKFVSPMDIILVGPYEHHSNYLPWKYLARQSDAIFLEMPLNEHGELDFNFLSSIADNVKIVAYSTVSNMNGFEINSEKLAKLFSSQTLIFTDESQKVAHDHIALDSRISGYLLSSHKMYAPKNIAGAFIKAELIEKMTPFFLGGGMIYHQSFSDTWSEGQQKFYAGTYDVGLLAAWSEACKYLQEISFDKIKRNESEYFNTIRETLLQNPKVKIINSPNSAKSLISFVHEEIHAHDIEEYLSARNFVIRSGNLCAQPALRKLDCNAVNRISFGLGLEAQEIKDLCTQLKNLTNEKKCEQYLNRNSKDVIVPDDILVRSGIACGDAITIQAELNNNILKFNYQCDACNHCKAVLGYLFTNYNDKPVASVINKIQSAMEELTADFDSFCLKIFGQGNLRRSCVEDTFKTCLDFFLKLKDSSYEQQKIEDTKSNLDCDACISTGRVAWRNPSESLSTSKTPLAKISSTDYPFDFRKRWMRLAKITLSSEEIEELRSLVDELTYDHVLKFARLKIEQMIFFHVKKYCAPKHNNPIWKNIPYRIYKKVILQNELLHLKNFIDENKLQVFFVKGAFTSELYEENIGLRLFKDYDMIALSAEDAFTVATFLFANGFKIFYNEFSLKKIDTKDGSCLCTGHFHLQKFVWENYEIIIDINFPGFPAGRISLYRPERYIGTQISLEDEFIITLCHLFKHKDVFMKDINDLFLILNLNLDYKYLRHQLDCNRLNFFAKITVKYILQNYNFCNERKSWLEKFFDTKDFEIGDWPYSYEQVYKFKRAELYQRSKHYIDHDRIYLFPLIIFDRPLKMHDRFISRIKSRPCEIEKINDQLYLLQYENFRLLICGMGVFWDNANDAEKCDRLSLERELNNIAESDEIKDHIVYLPYYLEQNRNWFD